MSKKPEHLHEPRNIVYDAGHWQLLSKLRKRSEVILEKLVKDGIRALLYGSLARGDISSTSDIDIIIPYPLSSYKIELILGQGLKRELVQATPSMVLKGHIYLEHDVTVTFPLFKLRPREEEFYRWGGQITLEQIRVNARVPGVDKRLILIEPTPTGHIERGVIGYEPEIARIVGVDIGLAKERVRVLTRRDEVGRTGVYLTRPLSPDESFEEVAKLLRDGDPALRRTMDKRKR
jgi:predicted nucleotidyltransferase